MSINNITGNTQGVDVANRLKDVGSDNKIDKAKNLETNINKDELKVSSEFTAIQDSIAQLIASEAPVDNAKVSAAIQDLQSRNLGTLSSDPKVQLETAQRIANNIFGDM
tara:strand:+ start:1754 stop:2080 length:327 start_codon:yes stop_codon:yes gene_type:complete